jgi:hypothetical protein
MNTNGMQGDDGQPAHHHLVITLTLKGDYKHGNKKSQQP